MKKIIKKIFNKLLFYKTILSVKLSFKKRHSAIENNGEYKKIKLTPEEVKEYRDYWNVNLKFNCLQEFNNSEVSHITLPQTKFDAIVLTVAHKEFTSLDLTHLLKEGGVIYDVKGTLMQGNNRL